MNDRIITILLRCIEIIAWVLVACCVVVLGDPDAHHTLARVARYTLGVATLLGVSIGQPVRAWFKPKAADVDATKSSSLLAVVAAASLLSMGCASISAPCKSALVTAAVVTAGSAACIAVDPPAWDEVLYTDGLSIATAWAAVARACWPTAQPSEARTLAADAARAICATAATKSSTTGSPGEMREAPSSGPGSPAEAPTPSK